MAVIKLHPSIKENPHPRMSAAALAEYLIFRPDQQERILQNSRFSSPIVVTPYRDALTAVRAYCSNPLRPDGVLETANEALRARSIDQSTRPKSREEALRCIETIELFKRNENAMGLRALKLETASRFEPLVINGVTLSVQPDLIVRAGIDDERVGAVVFRPQKAPDPNDCRLEDTRRQRGEHRRELGRYILAMVQMLFEEQPQLGKFDRSLTFVGDIRLGERIDFSTGDHAMRAKAIKAACKQIARLWDGIEPRPSDLR